MVKARKKQHSNQLNKLFQAFLFIYVTFICVASYKSLSWAAAYFSWPFLNSFLWCK